MGNVSDDEDGDVGSASDPPQPIEDPIGPEDLNDRSGEQESDDDERQSAQGDEDEVFSDARSDGEENMTDFHDIDGTDAPEIVAKLSTVKVTWDKDVEYYFLELENAMELLTIKNQWHKRVVLANNLPGEIKAELKETLKKTKSAAPPKVYKVLKFKIIALFGPKENEAFEKASQLILKQKPSALAKELIELLCDCEDPLKECCAAKTVTALWLRQLPQIVRSAVAGRSLKSDLEGVMKHADDVYASINAPGARSIAAYDVDENEGEEIAAIRGRGGRSGQRGGYGRGSQQQQQPQQQQSRGASRGGRARGGRWNRGRGQPHQQQDRGQGQGGQGVHPDGPPDNACKIHLLHGRSAYYCLSPSTCPWKDITSPRPQ